MSSRSHYGFLVFKAMFYMCIIRSITSGIFYKGFTTQPEIRLREHNEGQSNGPLDLKILK